MEKHSIYQSSRKFSFDKETRTYSGYALVFNSDSRKMRLFGRDVVERIDPAALNNTDMSDVIATYNHNFGQILGRSTANTLKISIDDIGLKYSFEVPPTTWGNDLIISTERGDITGSSFTMLVGAGNYEWEERDGVDYGTLKEIPQIIELGPVTYEAYPDTNVIMNSYEKVIETRKKHLQEEARGLIDLKRRRLRLMSYN